MSQRSIVAVNVTLSINTDVAHTAHEFAAELQAFIVAWEDKVQITSFNTAFHDQRPFHEVFIIEETSE